MLGCTSITASSPGWHLFITLLLRAHALLVSLLDFLHHRQSPLSPAQTVWGTGCAICHGLFPSTLDLLSCFFFCIISGVSFHEHGRQEVSSPISPGDDRRHQNFLCYFRFGFLSAELLNFLHSSNADRGLDMILDMMLRGSCLHATTGLPPSLWLLHGDMEQVEVWVHF